MAVSLIVERYFAGLDLAAANELIVDILARKRCRFCLQDDPDNGSAPCRACGRLMPPPQRDPASDLCRMHPDCRAVI